MQSSLFTRCVLFILVSIIPLYFGASAESSREGSAKIKGVVLDSNEAHIVQGTILVEGARVKSEVTINESGEYEVELPPGIYTIAASIPAYHQFRRAAFRLGPGEFKIINIVPVLRILSIQTSVTEGEILSLSPPPNYDTFTLPSAQVGLEVVVRFASKKIKGTLIEYTEAMVSYDAMSVYAEKVELDKNSFRLVATGKVTVEEGKQRIHASQAQIDLKSRDLLLNMAF